MRNQRLKNYLIKHWLSAKDQLNGDQPNAPPVGWSAEEWDAFKEGVKQTEEQTVNPERTIDEHFIEAWALLKSKLSSPGRAEALDWYQKARDAERSHMPWWKGSAHRALDKCIAALKD